MPLKLSRWHIFHIQVAVMAGEDENTFCDVSFFFLLEFNSLNLSLRVQASRERGNRKGKLFSASFCSRRTLSAAHREDEKQLEASTMSCRISKGPVHRCVSFD